MTHTRKHLVAGLEVFEILGDPGAPKILLFHGYGADASDMISLAELFPYSPKPTWLIPNAPHEISIGPGMKGRAWFPLDWNVLSSAVHQNGQNIAQAFPSELNAVRNLGKELIAELHIPLSSLFIGGFSQGAVLATDLTLHLRETIAGLLIFSGTLINQEEWGRLIQNHKGLLFFQSHGTYDPLLPYSSAQNLCHLLKKGGGQGELFSFSGGHEIPHTIFSPLQTFFTKRN